MNHDELDHYIETQTTILRGEEATDELFHFGIKGMKWGVRRFQNKDGSYTAAGKKRYSSLKDAVRNYRQNKLTKAGRKDLRYSTLMDYNERLHRKHDTPAQYARWYSSGAASEQRQYQKQLRNRTNRLMKKYGKKYNIAYDVTTGNYELRDKPKATNKGGAKKWLDTRPFKDRSLGEKAFITLAAANLGTGVINKFRTGEFKDLIDYAQEAYKKKRKR